jgi:hypothetical protein
VDTASNREDRTDESELHFRSSGSHLPDWAFRSQGSDQGGARRESPKIAAAQLALRAATGGEHSRPLRPDSIPSSSLLWNDGIPSAYPPNVPLDRLLRGWYADG